MHAGEANNGCGQRATLEANSPPPPSKRSGRRRYKMKYARR
ncbi:MAG: hypothetical protein ACLR23_03675 [Clostridia bacterium]